MGHMNKQSFTPRSAPFWTSNTRGQAEPEGNQARRGLEKEAASQASLCSTGTCPRKPRARPANRAPKHAHTGCSAQAGALRRDHCRIEALAAPMGEPGFASPSLCLRMGHVAPLLLHRVGRDFIAPPAPTHCHRQGRLPLEQLAHLSFIYESKLLCKLHLVSFFTELLT